MKTLLVFCWGAVFALAGCVGSIPPGQITGHTDTELLMRFGTKPVYEGPCPAYVAPVPFREKVKRLYPPGPNGRAGVLLRIVAWQRGDRCLMVVFRPTEIPQWTGKTDAHGRSVGFGSMTLQKEPWIAFAAAYVRGIPSDHFAGRTITQLAQRYGSSPKDDETMLATTPEDYLYQSGLSGSVRRHFPPDRPESKNMLIREVAWPADGLKIVVLFRLQQGEWTAFDAGYDEYSSMDLPLALTTGAKVAPPAFEEGLSYAQLLARYGPKIRWDRTTTVPADDVSGLGIDPGKAPPDPPKKGMIPIRGVAFVLPEGHSISFAFRKQRGRWIAFRKTDDIYVQAQWAAVAEWSRRN